MFDDFQSPVTKKKELPRVSFSYKQLVLILFTFVILLVVFFLFGVYFGKREFAQKLAEQKARMEVAREPVTGANQTEKARAESGDSAPVAETSAGGSSEKQGDISTVEKTSSPKTTEAGVPPLPSEQTGTTVVSNTPSETHKEPPNTGDTPASVSDTGTVKPSTRTPATNPIELTPITPSIDNEIVTSPVEKETPSSKATTIDIHVKQKPKTFSVQLSALTGDDAEKRARSMVEKLQKKYGNQFQFKIQPAGKLCKIMAINIPDEKTAREALRILSQEPDFKKAFIIKPQK